MPCEDVPELGNTLLAASGSCLLTGSGGIFSTATLGATNLIDTMGVPYTAEMKDLHTDEAGKQIGELNQQTEVFGVAPNRYGMKVFVEGWFDGPKDIYTTPGYAIYIRQAEAGLIEGVNGQMVFAHSGRINVLVRRRYRYQSGRTLPFDEIWQYRILNLDITVADGLRRFDARMSTAFSPAEPQHGDFPASYLRSAVALPLSRRDNPRA